MSKKPPSSGRNKAGKKASPLLAGMLGIKPATAPQPVGPIDMALARALQQAMALYQQKDAHRALTLLEPLAHQHPKDFSCQNLYAVLLAEHRRYADAQAAWTLALAVQPGSVDVLSNLGRMHQKMGDLPKAIDYLQQALARQPGHHDALLNLGVAYKDAGQIDQAIARWQQLLALDITRHTRLQTLLNLGTAHQHRFDFQNASAFYQKALDIDPAHADSMANLNFSRHYVMPQRPGRISASARELGRLYALGITPFADWTVAPEAGARLRIGLVSGDLRDHPVGYFLENLLHSEAAGGFDWFAYANHHPVDDSALTGRIRPRFAQWRGIATWSDDSVAEQIRRDGIHVLVDLSGLTKGHRLQVFARQPAPLQITWLGYFGTTGLPAMQAVLADPHCVPPHEESWFAEKVWRLPHTRLCFRPPTDAPAVAALPAPQRGHITFGCFQELAKINDTVLRIWGQIAQAVPSARWRVQSARLKPGGADREILRQRMLAAGLPEGQIELHGPMPRAGYLAAHAQVDVLLDTFAYPGGTTTVEALWMGVPTLTLASPGMLGRQGQGLLKAAGLDDFWVCPDVTTYMQRAVALAQPTSWPGLSQLRAGLRQQAAANPLLDGERFGRDWCALVRDIWRDACATGWPVAAPDTAATALQEGDPPPPAGVPPSQSPSLKVDASAALSRAYQCYADGRFTDALQAMQPWRHQYPDDLRWLNLWGGLQHALGQHEAARQAWLHSLQVQPSQADTAANLSAACHALGQWQPASQWANHALKLDPDHVPALLNLSVVLGEMHQDSQALPLLERAVALAPDNSQALFNLAVCYRELNRFDDSLAAYARLLLIQPEHAQARANEIFLRHYLPATDPQAIGQITQQWAQRLQLRHPPFAAWRVPPQAQARLRIGLLSADLKDHPVGHFLQPLLEGAAARQFDWAAYAAHKGDTALTARFRNHCTLWRDASDMTEDALAQQIHDDGIHILLDLSGYTRGNRIGVLARRPAPLQITWLGYFATTGLTTVDAVLADRHCLPGAEARWWSEAVHYLPHTRLCLMPPSDTPPVSPLPAQTQGVLTFGCFQNMAKINDAVLRVWAQIAQAAPLARWRIQNAKFAPGLAFRDEFARRLDSLGLNPQRVQLCGPQHRGDYLRSHDAVDVALDTFPYPGGTTTAEALWMGVPTLTLSRPGMLGRQGQGLLKAAGLGDQWVCQDEASYIRRAVQLAQPEAWPELARLRAGLRQQVAASPLFDGERFAHDWCALVRHIWRQACATGWPVAAEARI